MTRKFVYSPGLPGYGTKGVDGSAGLTGVATWFSSYDGAADTVTIKAKIIANKELFSNDELIPGYPTRTYQNGDIFVDRNARIYQIDFDEANLYKDTGIFLNTSGFFTSGPVQANSPNFERYSNQFETEKYLIDSVYSNDIGNYTTYPQSIYDQKPVYFGRVDFVDKDLSPDFQALDSSFYPFNVWNIDSTNDADAIALVRDIDTNTWRLGNFDNGEVRDVALWLDFNDLYCPSIATGTATDILYWDENSGRITQSPAPLSFTMSPYYLNSIVTASSTTSIQAWESFRYTETGTINKLLNVSRAGGDTFIIASGDGDRDQSPDFMEIQTGNGTNGGSSDQGYPGAYLSIKSGYGGEGYQTAQSGYDGGDVSIVTGAGGLNDTRDTTPIGGGDGGDFLVQTGNGGLADNSGTGGDDAYGGYGGSIRFLAGDGGDANADGTGEGGIGGAIRLYAGAGGGGDDDAGAGGDVDIRAGTGGLASGGANGGRVFIWAGQDGGASTFSEVFVGTDTGGNDKGGCFVRSGTAFRPGLGFAEARTNGFFYPTTNAIGVALGGTEEFRFVKNGINGDFHATGNIIAYSSTPSDIRLKTNVEDLQNPLDKVLQLRGVSFEKKEREGRHFGYIAQEIEEILPEVIHETTLLGEDQETSYKTVNYQEVIPYLSEAIKEQQKIIKSQGEKIDYLMEEIEKLKNNK